MNPRILLAAASILLGACAVGPSYHRERPVPAGTRIGAAPLSGTSRLFFDSLSAARDADTSMRAPAGQAPPPPRRVETDVLGELAWLDILRDSTLTRLVEKALQQNRDLAIARARIREFKAEVGVARAPLFPSVTLNGSGGRNQIAIGALDPATFDALRVTGDLAWELDFWGRTRRGVQAANADLDAREAAERATVLTLVSAVATGYLQLLELDQEKDLAEATLASRKETLALARQRFAQGIISELDVKQFEAQVAVPAVRLAQVAQERARQEHALSVLLGETPMEIPRGPSLALAARAVVVTDSLPATLLDRRPDVQEAERSLAAATARIGVARAARLPAFSITGSYGSQSPDFDGLFSSRTEIYQILGGISIPLFTGGRPINQERAAVARAEQAQARYEQTALTALREASDALADVQSVQDQVAAQETRTGALRRALELAEIRYRNGVANYLEVLEAQRSLFDAELSLSRTQLAQLTAAVQLYKALGGSWN